MTFKIFDLNGQQVDISHLVKRDTISCRKTFSLDMSQPLGTSELSVSLYDNIVNNVRFKPVSGQRIRWTADDGSNVVLFDGLILDPESDYIGKEGSNKKLKYTIKAQDASYLLGLKMAAEATYTNLSAGTLIDQLAVFADSRITLASNNDVGMAIGDVKLARKTVKDRIEELAKGSGLYVWIDENWVLHHKQYSSIINSPNDEDFDIDDVSRFYYDLKLQEDFSQICTRTYSIGSKMDAGVVNTQNRTQGKQKRVEQIITKTAAKERIDIIRARLGFAALPNGTNVDSLGSEVPGIVEKDLSCEEIYDTATLEGLATNYLALYSNPWLKGSVSYTKPGIVVGKSIAINSASRQVVAVLPVCEVEIKPIGNDSAGHRVYHTNVNLNGPSAITRLKQRAKKNEKKEVKAEIVIKPNPPTLKGHKSIEQTGYTVEQEVYGTVIIRSDQAY